MHNSHIGHSSMGTGDTRLPVASHLPQLCRGKRAFNITIAARNPVLPVSVTVCRPHSRCAAAKIRPRYIPASELQPRLVKR